jgi:hypothetical protein
MQGDFFIINKKTSHRIITAPAGAIITSGQGTNAKLLLTLLLL